MSAPCRTVDVVPPFHQELHRNGRVLRRKILFANRVEGAMNHDVVE